MSGFQLTLIFAFSAMTLWGIGDFLIQKTVKRVGDFQTLLWINLIAGLVLLPLVIGDLPAIFTSDNMVSLIFMTFIDLLYGLFLLKAYDQGKLSVVEVIMIGELPFTVFLGLIFFREKLDILQISLIALIILGVFLISKTRATWLDRVKRFFRGKTVIWERGIMFAVVAFVFSAIYNLLTAVNARNISAFTAVWFPWMLSSLFLLIYIAYNRGFKDLWKRSVNNKRLILITGIIDTAAWVFYALATSQEELSIITAIVSGYAVIAMILGVKFNREKIGTWQYIGAAMVFMGVVVMSFISN